MVNPGAHASHRIGRAHLLPLLSLILVNRTMEIVGIRGKIRLETYAASPLNPR